MSRVVIGFELGKGVWLIEKPEDVTEVEVIFYGEYGNDPETGEPTNVFLKKAVGKVEKN